MARCPAGTGCRGRGNAGGNIGLHSDLRAVGCLIDGAGGLISLSMLAAGAALLPPGHLGGVIAVLGSLTLLAVMAGFRVAGLRSLELKTPGSSGR